MYSYDLFMLMYETITICKVIILQLKKRKTCLMKGCYPNIPKKKKKNLLKLNNKTTNPIKKNRPKTLTNISSKKTNTLQ